LLSLVKNLATHVACSKNARAGELTGASEEEKPTIGTGQHAQHRLSAAAPIGRLRQ
jgi:hypothetical protein